MEKAALYAVSLVILISVLALGAGSRSFGLCQFLTRPRRRPWSFQPPTAAVAGDTGGRAGRATGSGEGLIPAAIMDRTADRDPALDPETAADTAGTAGRTAPAIRWGEAPSPVAITALIIINGRPV
jgi:hypothetical protein